MEFTLLFNAYIGVLIWSTSESLSTYKLTTHGLGFFIISFFVGYKLLWGDAKDYNDDDSEDDNDDEVS